MRTTGPAPGQPRPRLTGLLCPAHGWPGWKCVNCAWLNGRLAASVAVFWLICWIFHFNSIPFSCSSKVTRVDKAMIRGTIEISSRGAIFIWRLAINRLTGRKFRTWTHDRAHMKRPLVNVVPRCWLAKHSPSPEILDILSPRTSVSAGSYSIDTRWRQKPGKNSNLWTLCLNPKSYQLEGRPRWDWELDWSSLGSKLYPINHCKVINSTEKMAAGRWFCFCFSVRTKLGIQNGWPESTQW